MVPIFKEDKKYKPSNYRPVSSTCICCKLLEQVVVRNIMTHFEMTHLETNKIFYDWQNGFRAKKSAETQLVTNLILLDFSKAFDNVSGRNLNIKALR